MPRRRPLIIEKCYLIHLARPFGHARHYLGTTKNISLRMYAHEHNKGAALLKAVNRAGIRWEIVRTWLGGYELEKQLKRQKNSPRLCPLCNGQAERERVAQIINATASRARAAGVGH